jgi:hypothetical protein
VTIGGQDADNLLPALRDQADRTVGLFRISMNASKLRSKLGGPIPCEVTVGSITVQHDRPTFWEESRRTAQERAVDLPNSSLGVAEHGAQDVRSRGRRPASARHHLPRPGLALVGEVLGCRVGA